MVYVSPDSVLREWKQACCLVFNENGNCYMFQGVILAGLIIISCSLLYITLKFAKFDPVCGLAAVFLFYTFYSRTNSSEQCI